MARQLWSANGVDATTDWMQPPDGDPVDDSLRAQAKRKQLCSRDHAMLVAHQLP